MIITEEMVLRAIELVRPTAEALLESDEAVWGPRWAVGEVMAPGLDEPVRFQFGEESEWDSSWGPERETSIAEVARRKREASLRERTNTSSLVFGKPWALYNGEFLYPGGVYWEGISIGISGLRGWADEALGEMLAATIVMLSHLEVDRRIQNKEMRL